MKASEFKAWLEGYMTDRPNPDAQVIAKKAGEIDDFPVIVPQPAPMPSFTYPPVWTGDRTAPAFTFRPVTCSGASQTNAIPATSVN